MIRLYACSNSMQTTFFFLFISTVAHFGCTRGDKSVEKQLFDDAFVDYDPRVLPIRSRSDHVTVHHSMELIKLHEVTWEDELLSWNASQYADIKQIYVHVSSVWQPMTILENNAELWEDSFQRITHLIATVENSTATHNASTMILYYPASLKVSCQMDIRNFPWDVHTCHLQFYSAIYPTQVVKYAPGPTSLSLANFAPHQQWIVRNFSINSTGDDCKNLDNSCSAYISYVVVIQRRSLYYVINLLVPSVVINTVGIIGLFTTSSSFGERTEKITMGITALLSLSVFLLIVSDHMPVTSTQIPLMTWFFIGTYVLLVVAVGASVFIMRVATYKTNSVLMSKKYRLLLALLTCTRLTSQGQSKKDSFKHRQRLLEETLARKEGPNSDTRMWEHLESALDCFCLAFFLGVQGLIVAIFLAVGYST